MAFSYPQAKYDPSPFPHVVIRGAWDSALLDRCKAEFGVQPKWDGEKQMRTAVNKRWCSTWERISPSSREVISECHGPMFLRWLQAVTGEEGLMPDPYLHGGGMHSIGRGGFLKMHVDFNYQAELRLYRRLNLLLYLNRDWKPEWKGQLLLGDGKKSIEPAHNTMVIFTTDDESYHGHPEPLECPEDVRRDSIALYFYSAIEPKRGYAGQRLNTTYR